MTIPLTGRVRPYAWGSTTAIPRLVGSAPTGEPVAELWFGAHPDDPSGTPDGPLDRLVTADPRPVLGERVLAAFGPRLPYLAKLLAARIPLSLQVHPSAEQAAAGYADEQERGVPAGAPHRRYRDPYAKPELLYALTDFDALCSFRPVERTLDLLDALAVPDLAPVAAVLRRDGIRAAMALLFALPEDARCALVAAVSPACARLAAKSGAWRDEAAAAVAVGRAHPRDIGLVVSLLLNLVRLQPGQAVYLGAGQVHAYLAGFGVEVLAASDNVLRCGLTPKHVDVEELLRIADFAAVDVHPLAGPRFVPPVPDFRVDVLTDADVDLPPDVPVLVLCLEGTARLADRELTAGAAALVPAATARRGVRCTGQALVVEPNLT